MTNIGQAANESARLLACRRDTCYTRSMADAVVGLADAIAALREELLAALHAGGEASLRFRLAPVELTLQAAVTKGADGKIGWHVLGVGGTYSSVTTQTLTLRLDPVWQTGDGSSATDFTIADQGADQQHVGPKRETAPS